METSAVKSCHLHLCCVVWICTLWGCMLSVLRAVKYMYVMLFIVWKALNKTCVSLIEYTYSLMGLYDICNTHIYIHVYDIFCVLCVKSSV